MLNSFVKVELGFLVLIVDFFVIIKFSQLIKSLTKVGDNVYAEKSVIEQESAEGRNGPKELV